MVIKNHRGKNTRPGPSAHDDRLVRNFTASAPNELCLADITERRIAEANTQMYATNHVLWNWIVSHPNDSRIESCIAVNELNFAIVLSGGVAGSTTHTKRRPRFRGRKPTAPSPGTALSY